MMRIYIYIYIDLYLNVYDVFDIYIYIICMWYIMYGNFLKWNVTQISHLNRIFHYYKPSILGYPH